jgi:hypothetical protein
MTAYGSARDLVMRGRRLELACMAAGALYGTSLAGSAVANPTFSMSRSPISTIRSPRSAPAPAGRLIVPQRNIAAPPLDLRLPTRSAPTVTAGPDAFESHSGVDTDDSLAHPGSFTREAGFPLMHQPETWLHRARREGVPIARLWSSRSALLSIGLNQKGKPGLWLIQKIT